MKYGLMGIIMPMLVQKPIFDYMKKACPEITPKMVKKEFKALIARQPDIGGSKNNLIMGLYLAAYTFAFYKAAPDLVTEEVYEGLIDAVAHAPSTAKLYKGKNFFTQKNMETRKRLATDPTYNGYSENWKYTFTYDPTVPQCEIIYTECAICKMAHREGCAHLMRYACTLDYVSQEFMGNKLVRTKTIGNGDDICDFNIIGKH